MKYKQIESTHCVTLSLEDDPEVVSILKSGFEDLWVVVIEDPVFPLKVEHMNREQIQEIFGIKV